MCTDKFRTLRRRATFVIKLVAVTINYQNNVSLRRIKAASLYAPSDLIYDERYGPTARDIPLFTSDRASRKVLPVRSCCCRASRGSNVELAGRGGVSGDPLIHVRMFLWKKKESPLMPWTREDSRGGRTPGARNKGTQGRRTCD